jgi:hypothetical protein
LRRGVDVVHRTYLLTDILRTQLFVGNAILPTCFGSYQAIFKLYTTVFEGVSKILRTDAVKIINLTTKLM